MLIQQRGCSQLQIAKKVLMNDACSAELVPWHNLDCLDKSWLLLVMTAILAQAGNLLPSLQHHLLHQLQTELRMQGKPSLAQ